MKRIITLILAAILATSPAGCVSVTMGTTGATGTVQGKGEIITVDFPVDSFAAVDLYSSFDVVYKNGPCGVQVTLHENLEEYMDITVEDGVLNIRSTKHFNVGRDEGPVIYITAPTLSAIYFSGQVDMRSGDILTADSLYMEFSGFADLALDLDVGELEIVSSGASNLTLTGRADDLVMRCSGSSNLSALELEAKNASIAISGSADATISCSDMLDVRISGAGSVRYRGNPHVSRTITGAGSVAQIKD